MAGYERGPRRPARACVCCDGPSVKPRVAPGYALSVENCTSHPSKHQSAAFACTPLGGGCGRFASVNAGQRHAEHLSLSEKNGARRRSGLGRLLRRALALRPACTRTAPQGTEAGVRNHESHTYSGRPRHAANEAASRVRSVDVPCVAVDIETVTAARTKWTQRRSGRGDEPLGPCRVVARGRSESQIDV